MIWLWIRKKRWQALCLSGKLWHRGRDKESASAGFSFQEGRESKRLRCPTKPHASYVRMQNICSPGHPHHPGHPWGQETYTLNICYCTYMLRCPTSHLLLRLECKTYAALQKQKCNEQRAWRREQVPANFFAILYDTRYCIVADWNFDVINRRFLC